MGRAVICGGLLLIIMSVGFSRLYLEKHWVSDVVGAYIAGGLYLTTSIWFLKRQRSRRRKLISCTERGHRRHFLSLRDSHTATRYA